MALTPPEHLRSVPRAGDVQRVFGDSTVRIARWRGEALGMPGRLAALISGVAPGALLVTGLMAWWRRRGARHARARGAGRLTATRVLM